jgi:hypothetical protein
VDSSHSRRVGLLLGAAVGIMFFLGVACYTGTIAHTLQAQGVTADAQVVEVIRKPKGTTVTVEFVSRDGAAVTVVCSSCGPELVEGDIVQIRYDPASLDSDVEAVGNRGNRRVALFALAMAACLSVVAGITATRLLKG